MDLKSYINVLYAVYNLNQGMIYRVENTSQKDLFQLFMMRRG